MNDTINRVIPKNKKFWSYAIIGSKGRGKSSILLKLLDEHLSKYYDNIFFVSTTALMDKKFENLLKELIPEGKFFDHFSEEVIHEIADKIREFNEEFPKNPRSLLILDDCISELPRSMEKGSYFNKFFVGSRHYKCDIIITTQSYKKLNTLIRNNLDLITMFHSNNKQEIKNLLAELNITEESLLQALESISEEPHSTVTINFMEGKPLICKNFTENLNSQ